MYLALHHIPNLIKSVYHDFKLNLDNAFILDIGMNVPIDVGNEIVDEQGLNNVNQETDEANANERMVIAPSDPEIISPIIDYSSSDISNPISTISDL